MSGFTTLIWKQNDSTEWHHTTSIKKMKPKRCPQSVRSRELSFGMLRMHFGQVFAMKENIHAAKGFRIFIMHCITNAQGRKMSF
jgi:hypothetical protein